MRLYFCMCIFCICIQVDRGSLGSTAIVAVVVSSDATAADSSSDRSTTVYVANVGDSRAILCSLVKDALTVTAVTADHKAAINQAEMARCAAVGPDVM